ncbi:hypothetical protein V6N13_041696 [Hibiscus sabdariffa]
MVNGERTEEFIPERGLRQGDPLSPFLFLLISNVLSWIVDHEQGVGNLGSRYLGIPSVWGRGRERLSVTSMIRRSGNIKFVPSEIHVRKTEFRRKSIKTLTLSSLISSKYSLDVFHELTNNLIYKAPRSNRQVAKRTPSFLGFSELTHQAKRPGENHNFDFQNMLCLNLESPGKISLRSLLSPPE